MHDAVSTEELLEQLSEEISSHSRVLYCNRIDEYSTTWNTTFHTHDFLEIMYFIKGEALVKGQHSSSSLSSNDLILYPPGFGHKEYMDFSKHQEVVCIAIELRKSFSYSNVLTMSDPKHRLEWIFKEFHRQYVMKDTITLRQLKYLLFRYLIQTAHEGNVILESLTNRVQEYILSYYQEHITQLQLCELVNVSPSYLNRIFKNSTGQTPVEFINRVRIEQASELIKKKHLTIEAVASEVGIKDPKYFSKVFKKFKGFSPREFRQSNNLKESYL